MFQRILAPLDGSDRAEKALPVAARIARATGGTLVLLQAIPPSLEYANVQAQIPSFTETLSQEARAQAISYLTRIAGSASVAEIKTEIHVLPGVPAQSILTFAHRNKVDLIVLCSHGYTGFKKWALGSVAQHIMRHSSAPVLLLREGSPQSVTPLTDASHPLRVVVALDGSSLAETALVPTIHLVSALSAPQKGELHLLSIVKPSGQRDPLSSVTMQERAIHAATAYLQMLSSELHVTLAAELGVTITTTVRVSLDVADALIRGAELGEETGTYQAYDLLALATHGRSGLERWAMGSMAERILDGSRLPLLIVRPQRQQRANGMKTKEQTMVKA